VVSLKKKRPEEYVPVLTPLNLQKELDSLKKPSQWRKLWALATIMGEIVSNNIPPKRG